MPLNRKKLQSGFTLVEVLVATVVFLMIALGIYGGFTSVSNLSLISRQRMVATALANEQLEVVRNLPYSDIGIIAGLPPGKLPHQKTVSRNGLDFAITTSVRSLDDPFDGTIGGSPNDPNPADYKLAEVEINCANCRNFTPITLNTTVAPKNLETNSGNGALFIRVLDSNGLPVAGASVEVVNASSTITVNDVTNNSGMLQLVDVPPANIAYQISVSKSGYSSSRTYSPNETNLPNPYLPDATVAVGQVTQISFIIEHLSNLTIKTVDNKCQPIGSFVFEIYGSKLIGTNPPTLAYDSTQTTSVDGLVNLIDLVWDNYHFTPKDSSYTIAGSLPPQSISLPAGADLTASLVLSPVNPKSLVVNVKDAVTGLPISGATVSVTAPSGGSKTEITSRGFISQSDWSFAADTIDNNVDINNPNGEVKLKEALGTYPPEGVVISRVFDTGSASSTYYLLSWQPGSQATSTGDESVKFQLATGDESATTTWDFIGPDGTAGTYYTVSGTTVSEQENYHRYLRYKMFLSTADANYTPEISDVAITYGSECLPAGQVYFDGLSAEAYDLSVTKGGYQDYFGVASTTANWQTHETVINHL
ncbi:MAG: carboxypeptidase regulatory-like domain-containing protein [Candidatus Paceibacterota bacterium]|jgi:prepilin-type N-terminal cleavage/methylation domain-containing protein